MQQKDSFEQAITRLEEIVEQMENGTKTLDESLKLYEEGVKLADICGKKLTAARKKIETLSETPEKR